MPITGPIPLPGSVLEAMFAGGKEARERRLAPFQQELMEAQAKEHSSEALKSEMIGNLLKQYLGSGSAQAGQTNQPSQYQLTNQDQSAIQGLKPGESYTIPKKSGDTNQQQPKTDYDKLMISGLLGLSTHPVEGQIITPFGPVKIGETPQEKREAETKTKFTEGLNQKDIEQTKSWNDVITANSTMKPALDEIHKISANPVFQNMYKNPEYFGKDIDWLRRFGKPEEIDAISRFSTNQKSLYANTGQEFKGAFRQFEKRLFDKALPDEHDPLQAIIAKTQATLKLRDLVTQRFLKADEIYRAGKGDITPGAALQIAEREINEKQVSKQIEDEYDRFVREQKHLKKEEKTSISNQTVELYDPQGKLIGTASPENATKFLQDHRGYSQKVIKNG